MGNETLLVMDFGGQYKELIARAVRGLSVYSEIKPGGLTAAEVAAIGPIGIIFTGGPNSVYADQAPRYDPEIFALGIPILGICYGMQLMCHALGGQVGPGAFGEYGRVPAQLDTRSPLFAGLTERSQVLMSHTDGVRALPPGFLARGSTGQCPIAACEDPARKLYGVQFHPEVAHTDQGREILKNFLTLCHASGDYRLEDYIAQQVAQIRAKTGDEKILLALSGGVDSSVCAALLAKAAPGRLFAIFVDHGFLRLHEGDDVEAAFRGKPLHFIRVNAQERFLRKIQGVTDPEVKRKRIGEEFIRVFEEEAAKLGNIRFFAQGTIYPDVVESGGAFGATIKSHHNVGGLPEHLAFTDILEPLSGLFKDEVRALGRKLRLPRALVDRQPFPGPGLSIRVMGEVTEEKLAILRQADRIFCDELARRRKRPQQYFAVFTNVRSVGVKGDSRAYDYVIALRAVHTTDFMTCEYADLPHKTLSHIAGRIANEVPGVSRVVYDITGKPPGTVEWE
jgi:GMP synthase (glutamine-hydrolysing)